MIDGQATEHAFQVREHHWDAMRAFLMLLGIPYHIAMAYRTDMPWILSAGQGAPAFNGIAQAIHVFRMPAFFVIAGYFAALLLARRSPDKWLRDRATRLGVPLVAALVTLIPLFNLICELSNFGWRDALGSWKHNSMTSGGYWIRHLWFLIVLLYLNASAAMLCWAVPRLREARLVRQLDDWLARHLALVVLGGGALLGIWQGSAIELFYMGGLATELLQGVLRLDHFIEFTPWFLIGCVLARATALRSAFYRFSPTIFLFALAALALDLAYREQLWPPYGRFLDALAAVGLAQALIAVSKCLADRPSPAVQALVKASFSIYLFHLPILAGLIVLVGPHLVIPLALKATLFGALTLALSWTCWLVVRRSALLRFFYDGVRPPVVPARVTLRLLYNAE